MAYTGNPRTNLVDRVRLNVGDVWPDFEILHDEDYLWFLEKNNQNVNRASLDAARTIMFTLARFTRERTGDIEVYGAEWFDNYRKALDDMVKNPNLQFSIAIPYAGGISRRDMCDNIRDRDNNAVRAFHSIGCDSWKRYCEGDDGLYSYRF